MIELAICWNKKTSSLLFCPHQCIWLRCQEIVLAQTTPPGFPSKAPDIRTFTFDDGYHWIHYSIKTKLSSQIFLLCHRKKKNLSNVDGDFNFSGTFSIVDDLCSDLASELVTRLGIELLEGFFFCFCFPRSILSHLSV